jgi:peptide/nickel transport system permease protein
MSILDATPVPTVRAPGPGRRALGWITWLGIGALTAFLLLATVGRLHGSPTALVAEGPEAPSLRYPFGTDTLGRDLFARAAEGAWLSLLISVGAVVTAVAIGMPLGLLAGYRDGSKISGLIMRVVETAQALPTFIFVIFVLSLVRNVDMHIGSFNIGMQPRIAVALGLGFVPFFTRVARAATLEEMQQDYVVGLRALGVRPGETLFREVGVNVLPPVAIQSLLALAIAIFAEGGLSFLGLGVAPPRATLGNLIAEGSAQVLAGYWWYATLPGLVMTIGILGLNLLGDTFTDSTGGARSRAREVQPL